MKKKIEFIESYIEVREGTAPPDYQWSDNHGFLTRCKDCMVYTKSGYCPTMNKMMKAMDYCSRSERKIDVD